jgi:putative hydrolase of the HAD superfamily
VKYKAVFFDAGETLVHPHPSFPEMFCDVLAGEGYDLAPEIVSERIAVISDRFKEAAVENQLWTTSRERSKAFWLSVYRIFLDELEIDTEEDGRLNEVLYDAFSDHTNYRLFEDVDPVLGRLAGEGLILGVISNFEDWLEILLERLDVTKYFPIRVISGVEGIEKPDPAIFRIALERAGVDAAEAVYVGDNPHFDVEPAAAVGMFPVLIDRRNRHAEVPSARIVSMADLPGLVGA